MQTAPLVLFVYNRPHHTRRCIEALQLNDQWNNTDVIVYCDGPKDSRSKVYIEETIRIAEAIKGCKSLRVIKSPVNKGLYQSVLDGVTVVLNEYGKVIVMEDDLVTSSSFLRYMNEALNKYKSDERVACISGYVYPLAHKFESAFFVKGADCWGWATWKDRWNDLETDAGGLLKKLAGNKKLEDEFTFNHSYPYLKMLSERVQDLNQSWAIIWYASAFLKGKLCLYPNTSLVRNIGNDGSGTHSKVTSAFDSAGLIPVNISLPGKIEESPEARLAFELFFRSIKRKSSIFGAVKSRIKRLIRPYPESMWSGDYGAWQEVMKSCSGYDQSAILDKVKDAVLKVRNGEAVYERDSVVFHELHYSVHLLNVLRSIAKENNNIFHIVDFGGSLGSSYFQYRNLLSEVKELSWNVVEQPNFVDCGSKFISDGHLNFYYTIEEALSGKEKHLLILSSVLPYIEDPYELIRKIVSYGFENIIIDRTSFIDREKELLAKQSVPESIYKASYPTWFFNEAKFIAAFLPFYRVENDFESEIEVPIRIGKHKGYWKGFYLRKKGKI